MTNNHDGWWAVGGARAACASLVLASALQAQSFTGFPAVDSAAVARAAWSSAVRATRANDHQRARGEIERAAAAWPTQPTYAWARVTLAAGAGDTAAVERGLRAYAALGLGRDLRDTVFDRYRALPWFGELSAAHAANIAPLARSRVAATLSDSTLWPEGIDGHPRTGSWFVASVAHGTVIERTRDGRERALWPRGAHGASALAVRVDPRGDRVWVTLSGVQSSPAYSPADSTVGALLEARITDGVVLRRWDLPRTRVRALGDVAIAANGDVLMTDSFEPVLYRLRAGADSLGTIKHPLFRSLQGIAPTADARVAYVADYSHGILRVDLVSGAVTRVREPANTTTLGVDGLSWTNGSLIAVQNGVAPARIMRFELDRAGTAMTRAVVLDRRPDLADEPTIGTIVGSEFVYVANSSWEKFAPGGVRQAGTVLTGPLLLAVPIR
jgi:hypothetical protein